VYTNLHNMNYLEENRNLIFKKYTEEELLKDIRNFTGGKGRLYKVLNHFFEEEMFKCKGGRGNLSPMGALKDNSVVESILEFTKSKPKFYVGNDIANVKSFFRNAGRKAQKVSNFPVRQAVDIYNKYTEVGGNIFDMSCGFGSRMSAALLLGRNYVGTDPNPTLYGKLLEYGEFLKNNGLLEDLGNGYKIIKQGSEILIPLIENKVDLCFTSPPYFDLEDYGNDENQSIKKFNNYDLWLEKFARPTIENCFKYLKVGGYLAVNVKNMTSGKKYKLYDDWFNIASENKSFEFVEVIEMKQGSKRDYKDKHFTGVSGSFGFKEPVMVFRKV